MVLSVGQLPIPGQIPVPLSLTAVTQVNFSRSLLPVLPVSPSQTPLRLPPHLVATVVLLVSLRSLPPLVSDVLVLVVPAMVSVVTRFLPAEKTSAGVYLVPLMLSVLNKEATVT